MMGERKWVSSALRDTDDSGMRADLSERKRGDESVRARL